LQEQGEIIYSTTAASRWGYLLLHLRGNRLFSHCSSKVKFLSYHKSSKVRLFRLGLLINPSEQWYFIRRPTANSGSGRTTLKRRHPNKWLKQRYCIHKENL
jgi:hypothetical protein